MVKGVLKQIKYAVLSVLKGFVGLFRKVFSGKRFPASSEKTNPFTYVSPVIASPKIGDQGEYYSNFPTSYDETGERIIAVPSNIAKAVANCFLKGRTDLAEAVFRGFGYGETRIITDHANIKAYTQLGIVYINAAKYSSL
jgi:hypothetical protein